MRNDEQSQYQHILKMSAQLAAARFRGAVDPHDVAQETAVALIRDGHLGGCAAPAPDEAPDSRDANARWSHARARHYAESVADNRPPLRTDPLPDALIATVAKNRGIDAWRHRVRRSATSLEALYAALGDGALPRRGDDAADPQVQAERRDVLAEELAPMTTFRLRLLARSAGDGEAIFAALCEGLTHEQVVARVHDQHPGSTLTHGALRKLVSSACRADPKLAWWLQRRTPPASKRSRGGGSHRRRPTR